MPEWDNQEHAARVQRRGEVTWSITSIMWSGWIGFEM
jgi:hypothetical protein